MVDEENEIWIGKSRLYLDEDNIIYSNFVGDIDAKIATEIGEATLKLSNLVDEKVNIFNDINETKMASSEARKILQKYIMNETVGKVAIFGLHPVARVLASFFLGVTKKRDVRYFKTKEQAIKWLKSEI